jgi:hypothetical protein
VVRRETNARVGPHGPDVRRLQPVLQALAGDRRETAWSRFKAWLRSILERRPQSTDEGWLARMVAHVGTSQSVIRLITYASLLAVVVLAGFIIVNEARTAGMLAVRRGAKRKRAQAGASPSHGVMQADLEQAAPADRPRLLLEMILRRLMDLGFLPLAGALTVRELTRIARLPEPDDRSRLAAVALAAERIRYSADESQPASLDESIIQGRELLERLNTSTPG